MTLISDATSRVIDIGTPDWCWSKLGGDKQGALSYQGAYGRVCLDVGYAVTGHQVTIALASSTSTGWSAAGEEACLEITGSTEDELRWVVRATGVAERSHPGRSAELALCRTLHPALGTSGVSARPEDGLVLLSLRVRGFYETAIAGPADGSGGRS